MCKKFRPEIVKRNGERASNKLTWADNIKMDVVDWIYLIVGSSGGLL
jgi:hypothetical protein